MRKVKKLISAVVSLMMVYTSMGGFILWSNADDENITLELKSSDNLSFSVNANAETTYTLNGETKVYSGQIILKGTLENGFTVENGKNDKKHDIKFNGVTINDSVVIKPNAIANIELVGTNIVTAKEGTNKGKAGINVPKKATLNLFGNGKLTATGSDDGGAGIGGNFSETAGTINIKDGIIEATGGEHAAGIGGGDNGNGGNITIKNATVTATGGEAAEPIGGGNNKKYTGTVKIGNITLSKSNREIYYNWKWKSAIRVNADNTVDKNSEEKPDILENPKITLISDDKLKFSINENLRIAFTCKEKTVAYTGKITLSGKLENGFTVENGEHNIALNGVTINDSIKINSNAKANIELEGTNTVTAKVKESFWDDTGKAGINVPEGATLNLSGEGKLTAKGSDDGGLYGDGGAGIGGNDEENAGTINIKCGTVNATGGKQASSIGGGDDGNGGNITIEGGTVNATGGEEGAGIGYGFDGSSGNITITGGTVNAIGENCTNGIYSENLDISGGTVNATGKYVSGIYSENLNISGGTVNARTINGGAGISGKNLNISGGTVNATAIGFGAGITGKNINISGGKVTAEGDDGGAGIGGISNSNSGSIKITGGTVKATGGKKAAGIGGGSGAFNVAGECENITIDNSVVIATAGEDAEPIGGGYDEFNTGTVTINGKELSEETRKKNKERGYVQYNKDGSITEYKNKEIPNKPLYGPKLAKTNSNT